MAMSDHDSLYHRLFSHPLMVEGLVRDFLPDAMAVGVDFGGMGRMAAKFYDRTGQRREGDVIWRLPLHGGSEVYLQLLLEFQSRSDWWMAVRAQVYTGLLWQQVIVEEGLKAGDPLPPVMLVVLHNGRERWTAPPDTAGLVGLPAGSCLWHWQPMIRYHVLDMGRLPGDELARRETLAALLVRLEQRHDPPELAALVQEVAGWFRSHPEAEELRRLFTELVREAMNGVAVDLPRPDNLREMGTMLETLGRQWREEWKAEGLAEGLAEGQAQGLAEGQALGQAQGRVAGKAESLIRLAERRFGPLAPEQRSRIRAAEEDRLDAWLDGVIEAPDPKALFGPSH